MNSKAHDLTRLLTGSTVTKLAVIDQDPVWSITVGVLRGISSLDKARSGRAS